MSACCDGTMGDSCPCACHDLKAVAEAALEAEDWAAIGEAILAGIRQGFAEIGAVTALHPLLDRTAAKVHHETPAQEAPPVDPGLVKWTATDALDWIQNSQQ